MNDSHSIRDTCATVARHPGLAITHLFANATLGAAAYGWLLIPEAAAWQVAASGAAALVLVALFLVLHAGTLAAFARTDEAPSTPRIFAGVARRLLALFVWLLVLLAGRELLSFLSAKGWAITVASWLTLTLQRPIAPEDAVTWLSRLQTALGLLAFALWLPVAREVAVGGFPGFRAVRKVWQRTSTAGYWLAVLALWIAGAWLPGILITWVPEVRSFAMEFLSMILRFVPAIALSLGAWLALLALVAQGGVRDQQEQN